MVGRNRIFDPQYAQDSFLRLWLPVRALLVPSSKTSVRALTCRGVYPKIAHISKKILKIKGRCFENQTDVQSDHGAYALMLVRTV